jgi:hypothetical protein
MTRKKEKKSRPARSAPLNPPDQTPRTDALHYTSECVTRHHLLGSVFFRVDPAQASIMPADVLQRFRDAAEYRLWRLEIHTQEEVFVTHMAALDLDRAYDNDRRSMADASDHPTKT